MTTIETFTSRIDDITYAVETTKHEDGSITCEIPVFNIDFYVNSEHEVREKADFMIKAFIYDLLRQYEKF